MSEAQILRFQRFQKASSGFSGFQRDANMFSEKKLKSVQRIPKGLERI